MAAPASPDVATAPLEAADPLRALFDRARTGDRTALDALCKETRPRLYRCAYAVLHDRDEADDVAQEALVRAVTKTFLFLGRGSVGGWMTRIALNLAKNRARDRKRRGEILHDSSASDRTARGAEARATTSADTLVDEKETRARLIHALELLPERQRDVMRLRAIADLSFADVARALAITEANARVTFSQAKKKLLESMSGTTASGTTASGTTATGETP